MSAWEESRQALVHDHYYPSNPLDPGEVILNKATENKNDLILIGSHGFKGMKKWLLGSTADYIINRAEKSVLVVK